MAAAASDVHANLYVTGTTADVSARRKHVFVTKLDIDGNVVYSSNFGGSGNDVPAALAVGADGSVYVAGSTSSSDLPITPGAYLQSGPTNGGTTSFVFKMNPDGSL